jgi:excinuclease ABC subunit C
MTEEHIKQKLGLLPSAPGVYVFRDRAGETLYVGKASSLKNRVRSYFQAGGSDDRYFIERLEREIGDLETFVAASEKEAALLENSLIKELQPRYNVKLRDDKEFLSLRLDVTQKWPRLEAVRRPKKDGARYFGPYHSATAARSTLRLVNRHFQLRTCTDGELESRTRPCLQFQIRRCAGPCVFEVPKEQYAQQITGVSLFLEGRHDELVSDLQRAMTGAAAELRYELAALYRDQLRAVESTQEKQRVSLVSDIDQDVFGIFRLADKAELSVLLVRRGRVVTVRTFEIKDARVPDPELVASFVSEYYARSSFVPSEVLLPTAIEAAGGLEAVLCEQRGGKVSLIRPQRGKRAALLRMAMENAAHAFKEKARAREDIASKLQQIKTQLSLPKVPERIECVDISHHAGSDTVAALVAFTHGEPDKKRYRGFRVRGVASGDDYAAIHQVLERRFRRGLSDDAKWSLPDLLVVDGGKGQLAMAERALHEIGVTGLSLAALAKEKADPRRDEVVDRVYLPGRKNAVELREGGSAMQILAYARDEAHRSANALRVKQGQKRTLHSDLDAIAGVGSKTRSRLLKQLGSLKGVRAATEEELIAAGASRAQARAIRAHLGADLPTPSVPAELANAAEAEDEAIERAFEAEIIENEAGVE